MHERVKMAKRLRRDREDRARHEDPPQESQESQELMEWSWFKVYPLISWAGRDLINRQYYWLFLPPPLGTKLYGLAYYCPFGSFGLKRDEQTNRHMPIVWDEYGLSKVA
jgi:hypothetical protein